MHTNRLHKLKPEADIDPNTLDAALRHRSFDAMAAVLGWILGFVQREFPDFSLNGARALEVGTGKFLNHALALHLCGCREVVTIDKYRQLVPDAAKLAVERPVLARRFLSGLVENDPFAARMQKIQESGLDLHRLRGLGINYLAPCELGNGFDIGTGFDFVFTYTVLEHVPEKEIPGLLQHLFAAQKPGAFCAHFVDLEDHRDSEKDPFAFLDAGCAWEPQDAFTRGSRPRFSAWKKHFAGFTDLDCRFPYTAVRNAPPLPEWIAPAVSYQDEADLRTSAFLMVGRRKE